MQGEQRTERSTHFCLLNTIDLVRDRLVVWVLEALEIILRVNQRYFLHEYQLYVSSSVDHTILSPSNFHIQGVLQLIRYFGL